MAYTASSDIIIPEVLADLTAAKFPEQLVLGNTSIVEMSPDFPMGTPGTEFKIPFWKRIAAFGDLTEGTAMVPGKITAGAEYAVVSRAGAAFEVTDIAQMVAEGDPMGAISSQLARRAAEKIDATLTLQLNKTPNTFDQSAVGSGTMDQNAFIKALVDSFGDQHQLLLGVGRVIMHSKVYGDLAQLSLIQNNYQSNMDVVKTGHVGMIMGLPIQLSDRVTTTTVSSVVHYNTYIAGPGALGLFFQRNVLVEMDRDILAQSDVIAATVHFSAHLFGYDDKTSAVVAEDDRSVAVAKIYSK
jgi:hypothetical protein